MKISLKWLNDHIDILDYASKANELAALLTSAGLEVEATENKSEQFKNVVVGHIKKLERHPNADRLTVCQVEVGPGDVRQIVCGAKNHKEGDKVVATLPGAVLPGNFEIKKSKIRDVESLGMLASESELGLKDEAEGILILPADAPVGTPFAEYYGLDDVLFEINVTPNRADCLSHLGLARELSCLLKRPLKAEPIKLKTKAGLSTKARVKLLVKDEKLCPRYSGRVLSGLKVGQSPAWLKQRLQSVGLNSINNVVDVTNFIIMDLGQPLHAFDLSELKGGEVIVAAATPGEKFTALDKRELTLTGDELTIRDGQRAVCLAGVIGGENSGTRDNTTEVFLESAQFSLSSVRKTARRHGVQTDSAYRFSRGTDPSGVVRALDRACQLIQEVAGGEISEDFYDHYPEPAKPKMIQVEAEFVAQKLGLEVSEASLTDWLERLSCKVAKSGKTLTVTLPEFRMDLEQDVDLVEEYGRLNGYDQIPDKLPVLSYAPLAQDKNFVFEARVAELARAAGFAQAVNFGFTSSKFQSNLMGAVEAYRQSGVEMDPQAVALKNPLNEDLDVMRVSLLPGLVKNLLHNCRHGNTQGRLFETGFVFRRGPEGYDQEARLAFVIWGHAQDLWKKSSEDKMAFFDLKGRVQGVLEQLGISLAQFNPWATAPAMLHPAQAASVFVEGRNVGFIGALHPKFLAFEKLRVPVAVGEFDLKALSRGQPRTVKFKSVPKFPSVERDLAFVLPKDMAAVKVSQEIKKAAGQLLQSIEIFDVFEGGNLPENHVSVAYRMVFQDLEGTLTEEKLAALQANIVSGVVKKLQVTVR